MSIRCLNYDYQNFVVSMTIKVQIFTHSRKTMSHCEFIDLLEKSWLRARSYVITDEHRAH